MKKILCHSLMFICVLTACANTDADSSEQRKPFSDAKMIQAFGQNMADSWAALDIKEEELTADPGIDYRYLVNFQVDICGFSFDPDLWYWDEKLYSIRYLFFPGSFEEGVSSVRALADHFSSLYGDPVTYPGLPNRLIDFLWEESDGAKTDFIEINLVERWLVHQVNRETHIVCSVNLNCFVDSDNTKHIWIDVSHSLQDDKNPDSIYV